MNIDRLKYFAAVVESKNLRKAAELVGIAPASMSKAISTLAADVGFELIRPEGRGIEITEKGLELYRSSATLLDEFRRFQERMSSAGAAAATRSKLRLATFEVFSTHLLASFLGEALPEEEALVLELTPGKIESAINDGIVDYGLTYLPQPHERLEFTEIGGFRMAIFGREKWRKRPFTEWPFAVPTTEVRIHSQDYHSLDLWPTTRQPRRVKYQFEMLETALRLASLGHAVLHCPEFVVKLHNRVSRAEFTLEELPPPKNYRGPGLSRLYLVARKGDERKGRLERKLARFFRGL